MRALGNRYTKEYKEMIVEVYNTGKPIKEICEEYGLSHCSVHNWVNKVQGREPISQKPIVKLPKESKKDLKEKEDELFKLKKENERIKMENEILKKAIAIFTQE